MSGFLGTDRQVATIVKPGTLATKLNSTRATLSKVDRVALAPYYRLVTKSKGR